MFVVYFFSFLWMLIRFSSSIHQLTLNKYGKIFCTVPNHSTVAISTHCKFNLNTSVSIEEFGINFTWVLRMICVCKQSCFIFIEFNQFDTSNKLYNIFQCNIHCTIYIHIYSHQFMHVYCTQKKKKTERSHTKKQQQYIQIQIWHCHAKILNWRKC